MALALDAVLREVGAPSFSTKLSPPRIAEGRTLRRERLLERLHGHLADARRATVVTAPAGYGKTTLLAHFAADVDALVAWCTLDEHDRDAVALLGYLVAAVARKLPGFGRRTRAALEALERSGETAGGGAKGGLEQVRAAVGVFVTELEEDVPEFLVLALDDCHLLAGDASASAVLDPLLERLPEHCHLILAGRTLPDLPYLKTLAARRQVGRVEMGQLRLTPEETEQLVERAGIGALGKAQLDELHAQTNGWAMAALLLAPYAVETGSESPGETGTGKRLPYRARKDLFAFLAAEVLGRQPAALQTFLMRSSALPHVEVGRCAALLGRPRDEVERLLATAEERGLFLTRLEAAPAAEGGASAVGDGAANAYGGEEVVCYRYHDLFREFLLDTLRTQQRVRFRWLQRRAAYLAEAAGELPQAIEHALAGKHFRPASRLIAEVTPGYVASDRWHTLHRWLSALPAPLLDAQPRLLVIAARAEENITSNDERVELLLTRAERGVAADACGYAEAQLTRMAVLDRRGRYQEVVRICQDVLARLNDVPAATRAEVSLRLGQAFFKLGELTEAQEACAAGARLCASAGVPVMEAMARETLAVVRLRRGDLDHAQTDLEAALVVWRRFGNLLAQAKTLNNLGLIKHHLGDYAVARALLLEAAHAACEAGWPRVEACAWLSLGDVERDLDNFQQAREAYSRGAHLATRHRDPYLARYAVDALGQLQRLRGDLAAAEAAARRAVTDARDAGSQYEEALYVRSLGLVHMERREWAAAGEALDRSLRLLSECDGQRELARTRLCRAQLARAARRRKDALAELAALSTLLAELGYYGFLLGDARRIRPLLELAVGEGVGGQRLAALLADAVESATRETATVQENEAFAAHPPASGVNGDDVEYDTTLPALAAFALGKSEVRLDGETVTAVRWRRRKSKELFFYLLCNPGWRRREKIAADVWPEASRAAARSAFHTNTHCLRRTLHPDLLEERDGEYRLSPTARCWFDATEFDRLCRAGDGNETGARKRASLEEAVRLYRGPLLEDLAPEWAEERRRQLESLYVEALIQLGRDRLADGAYDEAAALAERAVAVDPYLEAAHELAMLAQVGAGRTVGAAHHYARHAERLCTEVATEPSPALKTLHRRLASSAPRPAPTR